MRRATAGLVAALALLLCLWAPQGAAAFGLEGFSMSLEAKDGSPEIQAGGHPFAFVTSFHVETEEREVGGVVGTYAVEAVKDLKLNAPPGLVAIPGAVPPCPNVDFLTQKEPFIGFVTQCPDSTVVGKIALEVGEAGEPNFGETPVYSLRPPPGVVAKIGFRFLGVLVTADLGLSESPPYNGLASVPSVSQVLEFFSSKTTLWGVPGAEVHDSERGECLLTAATDSCAAGVEARPFVISPRACQGPVPIGWLIDTWQHPGAWLAGSASAEALDGCGKLGLAADTSARPTSLAAQSPTGLDFGLDVHDEGIANPNEGALAGSDIRKAVVTLPRGMTLNPSQAEGLEVCSEAQLALERSDSAPGEGCPQGSKIGTIEVESPLLETGRVLKGALYVATPYENLAGDSLIAFYIVIHDPELGVLVTQAARVEPDPHTGQLITTTEDMPQLPFSHFRLHFVEGGRSPLISPPGCGSFDAEADLFPWAGGLPVHTSSAFQVISGPEGSPCPSGPAPFHPGFEAGTVNNAAKAFSPFDMRITRADGEQDITKFSATLPPGVAGILAGLTHCSDAAIAQATSRTGPHGGTEEREHPSCPRSSLIGHTLAGAGVGSQLTYVPGSLYLAGPYHGDPLSVVAITPALAGPFDAGTVVVRVALTLDPKTGEVQADGSASDPIPHILKGIPLNVRELRVEADRPHFTFNATNCDPLRARATLWGGGTTLAPQPDSPVDLATPYRAGGCASLGFAPKLAIRLRGGTRRGAHPALRAVVTPRAQDANFAAAVVTLPHSAFLDQAHIRTICTRVQFAAGAGNGAECPEGSVYGKVKVWTPILEEPAQGSVILRSSSHNLPDLVFALQGPPSAAAKLEISARIDSVHGGIRTSFESTPDFPFSRLVLDMRGANKGLIVNSTDLCRQKHRAIAALSAQNGRHERLRPVVRTTRCAKHH